MKEAIKQTHLLSFTLRIFGIVSSIYLPSTAPQKPDHWTNSTSNFRDIFNGIADKKSHFNLAFLFSPPNYHG